MSDPFKRYQVLNWYPENWREEGGHTSMGRKRFTPEQIIGMLREAVFRFSQGEKVKVICRGLGISE
jgi:hypothetical protein